MNDKFGVKMIYPSLDGGQEWYLNDSPGKDGRLVKNGIDIDKNSDGDYYYFRNDEQGTNRLSILTSGGQPKSADCSVNFADLAKAGHRHTSKDWKDVEMTMICYVQEVSGELDNAYLFLETRAGRKANPVPCCDGHSYGIKAFVDNTGPNSEKIAISKSMYHNFSSVEKLGSTSITSDFYRRWFGIKLIVYNFQNSRNETNVVVEFWYAPDKSSDALSDGWIKLATKIDDGLSWGQYGAVCGGSDAQPITWGSYLSSFGVYGGGNSAGIGNTELRFKYMSVREIDPSDVITPPVPPGGGDPGPPLPPVVIPPPADPSPTVTTIYNDLTLVYNINSDSDGCICTVPPFTPPPPTPGGGGGGSNTTAIYDFPHTGSGVDAVHLGVDEGNNNMYLQHGIVVRGDDSNFYNRAPKRVEIPLKKNGNPTGTASVVVRKGGNDSIQTTIGTIDASTVQTTTQYYAVENLSSTYLMKTGDMLLLEYDENEDDDDYLIAFTKPGNTSNDTSVIKRDNDMSEGDYRTRDLEMAWRVFA